MPLICRRIFVIALCLCAVRARADQAVSASKSVIIAGHPEAAKLGLAVLNHGGNAIDALVSVSLALNVTEPGNSGLGGKFTMLYYDAAARKVTAVVALESAPLKLDVQKIEPMDRSRGWVSVCTPGLAAALEASHRKWGTKPWAELVRPAADLAENGYALNPLAAQMMSEFPLKVDREAARIYAPAGHLPNAGDVLKNPDLAHTLRLIADGGADAFYKGPIAEKLVAAANQAGIPWTRQDFSSYQPRFIDPLRADYHGYTVFSGPPPLTGGATVTACLKCLEQESLPKDASARNAALIDAECRVLQQVYPIASRTAGDVPDSVRRVENSFSPERVRDLAEKARKADPAQPFASALTHPFQMEAQGFKSLGFFSVASDFEPCLDDADQASTTHLIIIDRAGNIICATQSLGLHFGSAVVAPGTGFLLNDAMNNLSYNTPSSVNFVAPGKWPRSTMAPTIVLKDDKPILAIGAPGGQRIPTGVLQVMVDVLDFHRPLDEAIAAPRFHLRRPTASGDGPNIVDVDHETDRAVESSLTQMGWKINRRPNGEFYFGAVNAAMIRADGTIFGVADQRRTGDAEGN